MTGLTLVKTQFILSVGETRVDILNDININIPKIRKQIRFFALRSSKKLEEEEEDGA